MTSPYLLIPPRTLAQVLADATERAIRDLRGRNQHGITDISSHSGANRASGSAVIA